MGEIAEMVFNTDKHEHSSNDDCDDDDDDGDDIVNTSEKISIDNTVKMCDQSIVGLEQRAFIGEQEIAAVYSISERLQEVFKKAVCLSVCLSATSSLENPVPGSAPDVQIQPGYDEDYNIRTFFCWIPKQPGVMDTY
jgi:hypothetical protein